MDSAFVQALLWGGAATTLVLYFKRRRARKSTQ
jgi:hypothetical protein